jgi:hypothetical protein
VTTLVNLAQLVARRESVGLPPPPMSRHLIFVVTAKAGSFLAPRWVTG